MSGTHLHQHVSRVRPLECAENEHRLYQSGNPQSTNEKQADQYSQSEYGKRIAIAHEMGTEDDKAQYDREVNEYFFHRCMMTDGSGDLYDSAKPAKSSLTQSPVNSGFSRIMQNSIMCYQ